MTFLFQRKCDYAYSIHITDFRAEYTFYESWIMKKLRVLLRMNNCNSNTTKGVKGPDCDRTGTHTTWFWHFKFTKTSAHLWQATWQHKYEIEVSIHQSSPRTPIQENFKYKKQGPLPISVFRVNRIFSKDKTLKKLICHWTSHWSSRPHKRNLKWS